MICSAGKKLTTLALPYEADHSSSDHRPIFSTFFFMPRLHYQSSNSPAANSDSNTIVIELNKLAYTPTEVVGSLKSSVRLILSCAFIEDNVCIGNRTFV